MTHLCIYPPDFGGELNSCFDDKGSVRMHGHTRLPLDNKCTAIRQAHHRKHHWSVPVSFVLKSNTWVGDFKPLHKVAEQVYDFLLQSRAVLNNWISFVRDFLLKLLQFLDLLSYLQLWLSQRGDPKRQRLRRRNRKKVGFKSRFVCEQTVYHVSKRSRQMFGGPPMQAICCLLFQSASSSSVRFFCTKSMADSSPAISVTICCKTESKLLTHL